MDALKFCPFFASVRIVAIRLDCAVLTSFARAACHTHSVTSSSFSLIATIIGRRQGSAMPFPHKRYSCESECGTSAHQSGGNPWSRAHSVGVNLRATYCESLSDLLPTCTVSPPLLMPCSLPDTRPTSASRMPILSLSLSQAVQRSAYRYMRPVRCKIPDALPEKGILSFSGMSFHCPDFNFTNTYVSPPPQRHSPEYRADIIPSSVCMCLLCTSQGFKIIFLILLAYFYKHYESTPPSFLYKHDILPSIVWMRWLSQSQGLRIIVVYLFKHYPMYFRAI